LADYFSKEMVIPSRCCVAQFSQSLVLTSRVLQRIIAKDLSDKQLTRCLLFTLCGCEKQMQNVFFY